MSNQMNSTWLYHLQRGRASIKWWMRLPRKTYNFNSRCNIVRKLISPRVFQRMTICQAYNLIPCNKYLNWKNHHILQNLALINPNLYRLKLKLRMFHPSMIMRYIRRFYKKIKRKRIESRIWKRWWNRTKSISGGPQVWAQSKVNRKWTVFCHHSNRVSVSIRCRLSIISRDNYKTLKNQTRKCDN